MSKTCKRLIIQNILCVCLCLALGVRTVQADLAVHWSKTQGPQGGLVRALAVNPLNPSVIYLGTASGLYKSDSGGVRWDSVTEGPLAFHEITALAIDPLHPEVVYAGSSGGLYRSIDAGARWVNIGGGLGSDMVFCIAIHPAVSDIVYVGMEQMVLRSQDRGETWVACGVGLPAANVWALAIQPAHPQIVYAGTDDGVYISADSGGHWYAANYGLPPQERVMMLAIDPESPLLLYAATPQGLFSSADGGASWSVCGSDIGLQPTSIVLASPSTRGALYANLGLERLWMSPDGGVTWAPLAEIEYSQPILSFAVHPQNDRQLYIGAASGFFYSEDQGKSWSRSNDGLAGADVRQIVDVPQTAGEIYAATRWGIYHSTNRGADWRQVDTTPIAEEILLLGIDPAQTSQLYALGAQGRLYASSDAGRRWGAAGGTLPAEAQATTLLIARLARDRASSVVIVGTTKGMFYLADRNAHWQPAGAAFPDPHVGALALVAGEQQYLYAGVGRGLYRMPLESLSASPEWDYLSPYPLNGRVTSIAADAQASDTLYVATESGGIYRTDLAGHRWENLTLETFPPQVRVEALSIVPGKGRAAMLCAITSAGMFCSTDQGKSWSLRNTAALQNSRIRTLASDDLAPHTFYLGTSTAGVFRVDVTPESGNLPALFVVAVLAILAASIGFYVGMRRYRRLGSRASLAPIQDWRIWDQLIAEKLLLHNRVPPDALAEIPAELRAHACRQYVEAHRDQDLRFDEGSQTIEPTNHLQLQQFSDNWRSLIERLDNAGAGAPIASRITEQLCQMLGFSPLEARTLRSVHGYVVRAPAVRLNIPPHFPIIFILKRQVSEEDLRGVRDLMSVLSVTSFFAVLIVVDDALLRRERAKELRRYVRSGVEDLIVLDYYDIHSLFLAKDAGQRFVKLLLDQVDLAVVSPYVISGPVADKMFFGREYELKTILRTIRDRSFAIVGGRKIGKTSLLTKVHRLIEQTSGFSSYHLDCQHVSTYEDLFDVLAITCHLQISASSPDAMRRVVMQLRQRHGGHVIVLLLDEIDSLLNFDIDHQMRLFGVFRALSQEGLCRFVFCGERRLHATIHDPLSPLFNFANVMHLTHLTPRAAQRVIEEPMASLGVAFESPESLPQEIIELSYCHPNLVQAICQMLVERVSARGERIIRASDLEWVRKSDEFREFFFDITWGSASALAKLITLLVIDLPDFTLHDVRQRLQARAIDAPISTLETALDELVLFSVFKKQGVRLSFAASSFPKVMRESNLAEGWIESLLEEPRVGQEGS